MFDSIRFYQGNLAGLADYGEIFPDNTLEFTTVKKQTSTAKYKKVSLLNGKIIVNYSHFKPNDQLGRTYDKIFINVESLSYLTGASTNLATVSPENAFEAFRKLQTILDEAKIPLKVTEALLCRVDLTLSMAVESPVNQYLPILRLIAPKGYRKTEYDGTNLTFIKNKANAVSIYDKFEHLKSKKLKILEPLSQYGLEGKHCLRFEHQYRDSREIRKHLRIATVSDLINNAQRLERNFKIQFSEWIIPRSVPAALRVKANNILVEHELLKESGRSAPSFAYHLAILRNCNLNIEEAVKTIAHIRNKHGQKFILRTKEILLEAMHLHRQIEFSCQDSHYQELLRASRNPIWI